MTQYLDLSLFYIQTEYFNTKELTGLPLETDPKFSDKVAINKSSSVVHIPTDVYSRGECSLSLSKLFLCNLLL